MNILIVGSGAREHALAQAFARSANPPFLYCFGTHVNPGIHPFTSAYAVGSLTDCQKIVHQALAWGIDLAIIGPEAPLAAGLVDCLRHEKIKTLGPNQSQARLETSKGFTRQLMKAHQIPGSPAYRYFPHLGGVEAFLEELGPENYVIKADGLMGGKGVKVAGDHLFSLKEARAFCQSLYEQQSAFVIEQKIVGQEFSLLFFVDGHTLIPMPLVQDHKRAYVDDTGPNTGGMGSYSDVNHGLPFIQAQDITRAIERTRTILEALRGEDDEPYQGILYGSFMAAADDVYLIEYNVRFGDPEAINLLPLLASDFTELCIALVNGELQASQVHFKSLASVCKYLVPLGYPDQSFGPIQLDLSAIENPECLYYGSVHKKDHLLWTLGSRTLAVLGMGTCLKTAEKNAQAEIQRIPGDFFHRPDIGTEALIEKRIQCMQKLRAGIPV